MFCVDQSCYELVYKNRKIQKNKWIAGEIDLAEENVDYTDEIDDAVEINYTDEIGTSEEIDATECLIQKKKFFK